MEHAQETKQPPHTTIGTVNAKALTQEGTRTTSLPRTCLCARTTAGYLLLHSISETLSHRSY